MATPPLVCAADLANSLIERTYFDKCTLLITRDNSLINAMNFCNYSMEIDDFFTQHVRLKAGSAFLLDDAGLGKYFGSVKFLLIRVKYPPTFTSYTDKYIEIKYLGTTYPIGELHIWTGNPTTVPVTGVVVDPGASEYTSPHFDLGGVVISNPHSNYVDLDIMIASSVPPGESNINGNVLNDNIGDYILI